MRRVTVFLVHRRLHFMARNTEWQRIGRFHEGIETTPQNNTADKKEQRREQRRVFKYCFQARSYHSH